MDRNDSSSPQEEENPTWANLLKEAHVESAVHILRREREERIKKLKRHQENQEGGSTKKLAPTIASEYRPPMKNLPHGWLDCPNYGKCIDLIIPSKVPLDDSFNDSVPAGKRYSPKKLVEKQRKAGRQIGLVIDLTNTTQYYKPQEWTNNGIKYLKIACKGRDEVPDNKAVNDFVYAVMNFIAKQRDAKFRKYILVHCTHGFNRTGFMIMHYLMRSNFTSVSEAIKLFKESREPGIYKRDYIKALYKFYNEVPEKKLSCPYTPEWKKSSDLDLNGQQDDDDDHHHADLSDSSIVLDENNYDNNITNDDILGDQIPPQQQEALQDMCYYLIEMPEERIRRRKGQYPFPGSHPVSLNKANLQMLRQSYYYATWKADGTRYMMLIMRDGCYLIDRNFTFRRIQMRFPLKKNNGFDHDMTLIDGEMIIDKTKDGLKRRYLAYDLMAINGVSIVHWIFCKRWKLLEEEIIEPRKDDKNNPTYIYDKELFSIRRKDFWSLSTVGKILSNFIPSLPHESDGLIFQGWDDPYVHQTHDGLLKWKFPEMNSVDFLFESESLFLYERGKPIRMDDLGVKFLENEDINALSGKIIECSKDPIEKDCWICMRVRYDKATPNDKNTYQKVVRSINDNITQNYIVKEIDEIVQMPMYQDRAPKEIKRSKKN